MLKLLASASDYSGIIYDFRTFLHRFYIRELQDYKKHEKKNQNCLYDLDFSRLEFSFVCRHKICRIFYADCRK